MRANKKNLKELSLKFDLLMTEAKAKKDKAEQDESDEKDSKYEKKNQEKLKVNQVYAFI